MGHSLKGDIVFVNFPFSDQETKKQRPAFVIKDTRKDDVILLQITKKKYPNSICIDTADFYKGHLNFKSYLRLNKIATLEKGKILKEFGRLKNSKIDEITQDFLKYISK